MRFAAGLDLAPSASRRRRWAGAGVASLSARVRATGQQDVAHPAPTQPAAAATTTNTTTAPSHRGRPTLPGVASPSRSPACRGRGPITAASRPMTTIAARPATMDGAPGRAGAGARRRRPPRLSRRPARPCRPRGSRGTAISSAPGTRSEHALDRLDPDQVREPARPSRDGEPRGGPATAAAARTARATRSLARDHPRPHDDPARQRRPHQKHPVEREDLPTTDRSGIVRSSPRGRGTRSRRPRSPRPDGSPDRPAPLIPCPPRRSPRSRRAGRSGPGPGSRT